VDATGQEIAAMGLRWLHLLGGFFWVGLGFFMNFVHLAYMPVLDPPTRKKILLGLVPRVLILMMTGAVVSVASGLILEQIEPPRTPEARSWLTFGSILGFVIFSIGVLILVPLILKAVRSARTGQPPPSWLPKTLAFFSKLNAFLAIPMIFAMLAGAGHFGYPVLPWAAGVCLAGWACVGLLFWKSARVSLEV
jgi:uncharacterized membrane protein